jgi:hypothetical protein
LPEASIAHTTIDGTARISNKAITTGIEETTAAKCLNGIL